MAASLQTFLVEKKVVTEEQLDIAAKQGVLSGKDAVRELISRGELDEEKLVELLSTTFSCPAMKPSRINRQALALVPLETIIKFRCLPVDIGADGSLMVAIADPVDLAHVEMLRQMLKRPVAPMFTPISALDAAIRMLTERGARPPEPETSSKINVAPLAAKAGPAKSAPAATPKGKSIVEVRRFRPQDQAINILNQILIEAVAKGASDIHIEPQSNLIHVRFRYEGVLFDVFEIPIELREQLANRIKVTAGLDIAERRVPQDGRAKVKVGEGDVSFRVSTMPSIYGENIVFRILRQTDLQLDVRKLGFDSRQMEIFERGYHAPNGMLLVTGPTGSGKTTTLYSALSALNERQVKIATVEDPVEYNLAGLTQVQVNKDTGLDFAEVLRSLLRQDPDIILVGEIRDQETASIAVQAALTGHLVLSSLHTNDAVSAVLRLLNMKVEPFAVLASIRTVVAQRLIRKVCPNCAEKTAFREEHLKWLGEDRVILQGRSNISGRGCDLCLGGGYRGRMAIFEVLELNDAIKEMFLKGENVINVKRHAVANGMKTLRQSALSLVASGVTSLEEAIALTLD